MCEQAPACNHRDLLLALAVEAASLWFNPKTHVQGVCRGCNYKVVVDKTVFFMLVEGSDVTKIAYEAYP